MKVIDLTDPEGAIEVLSNVLYQQTILRGSRAGLKPRESLKAMLLAANHYSLILQLLDVIDEDKVAEIHADVEVEIEKRRAVLETSKIFAEMKEQHDKLINKGSTEGDT